METRTDTRGYTAPVLVSWSLWAVSYCVACGIEIVGKLDGGSGRVGWRLDNKDGQAKRALDEWRSGEAVVNGRALVDAHRQLVDVIQNNI
jgi:hypothetical protein